jgi:transcriptional regulator with XRE-family HTH domain
MNDEQRSELRRFLKDRRARVSPAAVGIPDSARRRVRGLRREEVAALAGIGVSWYTALENGEAKGVSEATVRAVADALRLSDSEHKYLLALTGNAVMTDATNAPSILLTETMHALAFPAYLITAAWDILDANAAFRIVWGIGGGELPFNAVERLFLDPNARTMHGENLLANIAPVIAMVRSAVGRRPHLATLQRVRDRLLAEPAFVPLWEAYEISDPLVPNSCTIASPIGLFRYEALTLANPGDSSGLVVQVPDDQSRVRLAGALRG